MSDLAIGEKPAAKRQEFSRSNLSDIGDKKTLTMKQNLPVSAPLGAARETSLNTSQQGWAQRQRLGKRNLPPALRVRPAADCIRAL